MAKMPITKGQIVAHFAAKFELSKRIASSILDEISSLAVSETKKTGSFAFLASGNWSWLEMDISRRRLVFKKGEGKGGIFDKP